MLERLRRPMAAFLSGFALFIIIFTLVPFKGGVEVQDFQESTGNVINQVGFLSLGLIYLFAMLLVVDRKTLARVFSPTWAIIFAIAFFSCLQSYDPSGSARGVTLSVIAMIVVAGMLVLPRSERDFAHAGANAILLIVLIDYASLVLLPDRAIHSAAGGEPWHAGFWRGHLIHKNVAAPIFSVLCMFGIYCQRSGMKIRGTLITVLSAVFVLFTGSKTTLGFLPLAILMVLAGQALRSPWLVILAHVAFTVLIFCLTLGTIYFYTFHQITAALLEDPTFTGRDAIWQFASDSMRERLWFGHGFASFWLSPRMLGLEPNFEASWDVRGIVSGHNTYLDSVLTFGLPGGVLLILLLLFKPLIDFIRVARQRETRRLADFFLMVIIFMTYNGMMESFFLNRADPMWLILAMAVLGLGLLASGGLHPKTAPPPANRQAGKPQSTSRLANT